MAIQFVLGAGGTGKTRYLCEKMINSSLEKDHKPIIFLLPEQSNMAAEQDMVRNHPNGGTMDISILSFARLAYELVDKENIYTGDILDDFGKSMLIMKVLKNHEKELSYYNSMIEKPGFIDEVKSIISEFYQYQINDVVTDTLLEKLTVDKSLYHKISDIKLIIRYFEEEMGKTYMVAEQLLSVVSEHIADSALLKGAEVYFDGFTGFTPAQYDIIEKMMKVCDNLYFSFTIDGDAVRDNAYSEHGLFAFVKQSVERIIKMAADNNITVLPHIELDNNYRFEGAGELLHLERNLFRFPVKKYSGVDDNGVKVVMAPDGEREIKCIGRLIQQYILENGYHYRDIAIITGNLEETSGEWQRIFLQMNIPCFIDINEPMRHNPIVDIITSFIDLFDKDYSYDSVFSFLKTGILKLDVRDIYALENHALKYGIRGGSQWKRSFDNKYKGSAKVEAARKTFMDSVSEYETVFSKSHTYAREYIETLYRFADDNNIGEMLWNEALEYEKQGELRKAKAYRGIYDKFISVLDKTMELFGDEDITRSVFKDILLTGIADMSLGVIPQALDQVIVGDVERTRFHHVKLLIAAGANEGVLPKLREGTGLITDKDREQIKSCDVVIGPDSKERFYISQYYMYMQLTQASKHLVISYRTSDDKGGELAPAYFIKWIKQMFPDKESESAEVILNNNKPMTRDDMLAEFAKVVAEEAFNDSSLYRILYDNDGKSVADIISGYLYMNQPGALNENIALRLYGRDMIHTVSKLETFSECEYKFFLQYGLKLAKREEYKIEVNHVGTILHEVMEKFFHSIKIGELTLPITEKVIDTKVKELTLDAANNINPTIFESSNRMEHQLKVMMRIAKRSVINLCRHLEQGEMKPSYFEKYFSPEDKLSYIHMALNDGVSMDIRGIIDRVDIKETEDSVYVKVIDYKSGEKDIDFVKIIDGKQLQLAVYMSVMLEYLGREYPGKKIIPTGMFYYRLADMIVEGDNEDKIQAERVKKSRLTGLANSDYECLEYMDHRTGLVTPVAYTAKGEFSSKNAHLTNTKELNAISAYTKDKMIEIGEKIIRGQIDMKPQKGSISSPCNYCDFRNVCQFEPGLGGNSYGFASQLTKDEARQAIMDRYSNKGGEEA